MEVSAELMKDHTLVWLEKCLTGSALVGGILSIIHPELYQVGIEALKKLNAGHAHVVKGERLPEILRYWSSPFSVISVISNRETPFHGDNGSAHPWFDILVPLGKYENGRIELPGLGMRFRYNPGTVFGLLGRVLQHGATCPGDRVCVAYYMREQVVKKLALPKPSWMNVAEYH